MPERPCGESGGTARAAGLERQARTAWEENAGAGTEKLMEEVLRRENVKAAYERVVRNGGAAGVDGMTVEELMPYCQEHWARIGEELLGGKYKPKPVRRVEIPKADGRGVRTLGIPTVLDRMIQQAVLQVLTPLIDPTFSDASYGFRPGRSAHQAVERARGYIAAGHGWVVDLDIERFFDRVNHDVLMARVARLVKDKRVLLLIRRYLQAGVMEGGLESPRTEGTPQGGPLSPLLSNVLLDELDRELERRGHWFVRYADDCNVYVHSEAAGKRVMASLERFLWKRLRLRINQEKSAVARPARRRFLGYSVTVHREPRLRVARESVRRLRGRLKAVFRRGRGRDLEDSIAALNRILRGWVAYYRKVETTTSFQQLDAWINRRLRLILWRQWKTPRTRMHILQSRGIDRAMACVTAYDCHGPWWHSRGVMNRAVPVSELRNRGLVSLLEEHRRLVR